MKNIREIIREEVMDYHNSLVDSIYEDDNFLIAAPKTHQSSCHYGSGTQWCTTTKDSRSFDEHNKRGLLFYIIDKNNKSKFAIYIPYIFRERIRWGKLTDEGVDASFDSIEVYDSKDNDITGIWWSEDEPYYYKHIKDHFKRIYEKKLQINESDEWEWTKGEVYTVGKIIELGSENILEVGQIIYLTGKVFKDKSPDSMEFLDVNRVPVKVMETYKKGRGFKVITIEGSENLRKYISNNMLYLGMVDKDDDIMVTF